MFLIFSLFIKFPFVQYFVLEIHSFQAEYHVCFLRLVYYDCPPCLFNTEIRTSKSVSYCQFLLLCCSAHIKRQNCFLFSLYCEHRLP